MSKTLFKVLATAYLRHRQQRDLFQDCLAATSGQIELFKTKISLELSEIKEILDIPNSSLNNPLSMSVIAEETERSQGDDQLDKYSHETIMNKFSGQFNQKIGQLKVVQREFDELINIYKEELKGMAKEVSEWNDKNQKAKRKLDSKTKETQQLKKMLQESKAIENQFLQPRKEVEKIPISYTPEKLKENSRRRSNLQNQEKQRHINELQQQLEQQKVKETQHKWKTLSIKVENYRKKLQASQKQINEKDELLKKLSQKSKDIGQDDDEKKKLKLSNTNLRGEKILQSNQITTLKRQLSERWDLTQAQDLQIKKLRVQMVNLTSTLKWQVNTIQDLRKEQQTDIRFQKTQTSRIMDLEQLNCQLIKAISEQERYLEGLNLKIVELDQAHEGENERNRKRIGEMEIILEEKNQSIIKLRANSGGQIVHGNADRKDPSFYIQLVDVLKRKLAQKDQRLRRIQAEMSYLRR